ncbi:hypothetical protein EHH44_20310 [Mycolicibacter terrae]|uniref:Uncharacterized protein n=1 Tax=Mycolicibacter terrae TaxID=1788 RepID=A0ACD2EI75_9MYCO|nr:hypothetical protein [Mycolicibacter terrae]RRR40439.1 hypothetical protein EHH44_20310 [Mycolicibacter terrae]
MAPPGDPYRHFDQDRKAAGKPGRPEEAIADWLKAPGRDVSVRSVDARNAGIQGPGWTIPDGVIDAAGVTVEFKTIETPSIRAIRDSVAQLGRQSPYGVLDLRKAVGVSRDLARSALVREVGTSGLRLAQIVVVLGDDEHLEWRNE